MSKVCSKYVPCIVITSLSMKKIVWEITDTYGKCLKHKINTNKISIKYLRTFVSCNLLSLQKCLCNENSLWYLLSEYLNFSKTNNEYGPQQWFTLGIGFSS